MISADSEPVDVYDHAQLLLDRHTEARGLIDEIRRRADATPRKASDPRGLAWSHVDHLAAETWWRPYRDYRAAVLTAARFLLLGKSRAEVVHELASRDGYELARPASKKGPPAPAAAVGSAAAADLVGEHSWRSGATANRQARLRYLSTTASRPDRPLTFDFNKKPV